MAPLLRVGSGCLSERVKKMQRQANVIMAIQFMVFFGGTAWAEDMAAGIQSQSNRVTMTITESKVTETVINIRYQITNDSQQDIWLCEGIVSWPSVGPDFEIYLSEGSKTLTIRKRLSVRGKEHIEWPFPPFATYLRLPVGERRFESITLPLPIHPVLVFGQRSPPEDTAYATQLRIEIGYHESDLSKIILNAPCRSTRAYTRVYEFIRDRDRISLLAVQGHSSEVEQVLSVTSDVARISYTGEEMFSGKDWPEPPEFNTCTRIKVEYHPSMLDYFFPGAGRRGLFSHAEREYLQSQKTTLVDHPEQIATLSSDIGRGQWSVVGGDEAWANVACYRDDERLTSFSMFGDTRLLTSEGLHFKLADPLQSLRAVAPQIKPYELRVQCARNLKNLWYRFRLCQGAIDAVATGSAGRSTIRYPSPTRWTDGLLEAYRNTGIEDNTGRPYKCPSADEGKCHYAMNPNCDSNSPGDTVLLFETKAGWNQHGGPELFTFDNHDPRGGCILLNDGTVKFIRTKEELAQLRWRP